MATGKTIDTRREQMFPVLDSQEIDRLRRFGELRNFKAGDNLQTTGQSVPGMFILLSGSAIVTQRDEFTTRDPIVNHGAGSFTGELAQLSGRPSLVDIQVTSPVEALLIPTARIHALMVAEAELGERIMRALILRRVGLIETGGGGPVIVGRASQGNTLRLEGFLRRNGHPFQHLDPDTDPAAKTILERFPVDAEQLPIVLCPNGQLLRNPDETELARCLGLVRPVDPDKLYDVAIVGAGPAGLAASVYAGSEGLSVMVLDCRSFGGQAGASARIENYLGFPTGISGMALMARAFNQAQKFGVDMMIPDEARKLYAGNGHFVLDLINGERVNTRAVIVASGARYRRLDIANLSEFEGTSVHYWASPLEATLCDGQEVVLVGGGNSAGQAAVYLASRAAKVWFLARGPNLEAKMSRYLVDRIAAQPNIEVLTNTEVSALEGQGGNLEAVRWRKRGAEDETRRAIKHLFLFIGAEPNTDWLAGCGVELDGKGFIRTDKMQEGQLALETSRPGIFAIGDVRSGSVKRVAASVGEGAQVVAALHAYLATLQRQDLEKAAS